MLLYAALATILLQTPPPELLALGDARQFIDMRPQYKPPGTMIITDDGKRFFAGGPDTHLFTWEIGPNDDLVVSYGLSLNPETKQPAYWWRGQPGGGEYGYFPGHRLLVGLLDGQKPLTWHSSSQGSGLGWMDVNRRDLPNNSGILFWDRRRLGFVGIDLKNRVLFVGQDGEKQLLRAFKLGDDYRSTREIPVPNNAERHSRFSGIAFAESQRWETRWMYADGGAHRRTVLSASETDLQTGRVTAIPIRAELNNSLRYVGNDLFVIETSHSLDASGRRPRTLYLWERETRSLRAIGDYAIVAASQNGRFIIVDDGAKMWFVRRS